MKAYVGADWSATEVVCAVVGEDGGARPIRGGAKPFLQSVRELVERAREMIGAAEVYVLIEAGASVWPSLFHAAGAVVHLVDPKQARRFAESQGSSGAKDDRRDATSLAEMCRSPSHRREAWKPDTTELQRLDVLIGLHEQVTKDTGRVKQRLRDTLRSQMPLVEQALPKDLGTRWVARLLRKVPTPWHARKLTRAALDALLGSAQQSTRDRVWDALQRTEAPWLCAAVADTVAVEVRAHLDQLALLEKQLVSVEKQLDALTSAIADRERIETMEGIALKLSAVLIQHAFREGVPADRDAASVRMGASPVFVGSGRRKDGKPKGTVRMRRAASSRARRATYLIGRLASQHLGWARAMYGDAVARGQKAATAYRRIARCVLRIQTAMARDGEEYDDRRYVAALKAQGVPWAATL